MVINVAFKVRGIGLSSFFGAMLAVSATAQIRVEDPKKTAERSVEGRVNSRIDQGINKGLDKVCLLYTSRCV